MRVDLTLNTLDAEILGEVLLVELLKNAADQPIEPNAKLIYDVWSKNISVADRGIPADRLEVDIAGVRQLRNVEAWIFLIRVLPVEACEDVLFVRNAIID